LPIKLSAIEAMIENETTPNMYFNHETGKEEEWYGAMITNEFFVQYEIYNSRNLLYVDTLRDLLKRADTLVYHDRDLSDIINEEAAAFFAGQKTVEEVAQIIQSRAWIYVNTNR